MGDKHDHGHDLVRVHAIALLTAAGRSRQQIAEELGISVPTVQRAKQHPDFEQMVSQSAAKSAESLRPLVEAVSTELIMALSAGIATLRDMLDAEDKEGNPLYSVRKDAATKLVEAGIKLLPSGSGPAAGSPGGQGSGSGATSIVFNIDSARGTVSVEPDRPKAIEATSEDVG